MKINYPKVAEHLGVPLRGDETFTELLEIEKQVKECNYDIFNAVHIDRREEGILDDIGDLRRYLALVEAEVTRKYNSPEDNIADMQEDMFREDRCEWKTK